MRAFVTFWKKDLINKLIVLMILLLILGVGGIFFLLANMPENSLFFTYLQPTKERLQDPKAAIPSATFTDLAEATVVPGNLPTPLPRTTATSVPTLTANSMATETAVPLISSPGSTSISPSYDTVESSDITACIPDNTHTQARIVEVLDGNTVRAYYDGKVFVIRYIGLEVPSQNDEVVQAAYWKNTELVYAKDVILIPGSTETDSRGRILRYILVNGTFVNYELVRLGLASVINSHSEFECAEILQAAEEQAMATHSGIWIATPTP